MLCANAAAADPTLYILIGCSGITECWSLHDARHLSSPLLLPSPPCLPPWRTAVAVPRQCHSWHSCTFNANGSMAARGLDVFFPSFLPLLSTLPGACALCQVTQSGSIAARLLTNSCNCCCRSQQPLVSQVHLRATTTSGGDPRGQSIT